MNLRQRRNHGSVAMSNVAAVGTLVSLTLFSRFVPRSSRLLSLHSIMGNIELALLLVNLALQTLEVERKSESPTWNALNAMS